MFKEPVGRSARQVSRGHARNRETYHHPYTKTRSRCCYGRQCSVSAVSHQGDRCHRGVQGPSTGLPTCPPCPPQRHPRMFGLSRMNMLPHWETSTLGTQANNTTGLPPPGQRQGSLIALAAHRQDTSRGAGPGTPEQKHSSLRDPDGLGHLSLASFAPERSSRGPTTRRARGPLVTEGGAKKSPIGGQRMAWEKSSRPTHTCFPAVAAHLPSETRNIGLRVSSRANSLSLSPRRGRGTKHTRDTGGSSPPLAKSKSVTRGTRENQTRHGCGAHVSKAATTPGPAAASAKAGQVGKLG